MLDQLGRAPLASPLAPFFGTGASVYRPLLRAPRNVRSDGVQHRSSAGARVLSPSSVGLRDPFVMVEDAAGAAFIFSAARGNLLEILIVENGVPCLVEPGEAPSMTVAQHIFGVTV